VGEDKMMMLLLRCGGGVSRESSRNKAGILDACWIKGLFGVYVRRESMQ
jgi:hypothetical protein